MITPTPATLPGLLRVGTGVLDRHGNRGVWVERIGDHGPGVAWESGDLVTEDAADLVLDLDSPTSRAHLAWWILDRAADPYFAHMDRDEFAATVDAAERAYRGQPMNDRHINTLTTVARHLAGLESS